MVQHYVPSPISPLSNTQIGPNLWLLVGRSGEIMVEYTNTSGSKSSRVPINSELTAARQLTWWASPANPLHHGRSVRRSNGLLVRGWLAAAPGDAWWCTVAVTDIHNRHPHPPVALPHNTDALAYIEAIITSPTPSPITPTIRNGSRFLA